MIKIFEEWVNEVSIPKHNFDYLKDWLKKLVEENDLPNFITFNYSGPKTVKMWQNLLKGDKKEIDLFDFLEGIGIVPTPYHENGEYGVMLQSKNNVKKLQSDKRKIVKVKTNDVPMFIAKKAQELFGHLLPKGFKFNKKRYGTNNEKLNIKKGKEIVYTFLPNEIDLIGDRVKYYLLDENLVKKAIDVLRSKEKAELDNVRIVNDRVMKSMQKKYNYFDKGLIKAWGRLLYLGYHLLPAKLKKVDRNLYKQQIVDFYKMREDSLDFEEFEEWFTDVPPTLGGLPVFDKGRLQNDFKRTAQKTPAPFDFFIYRSTTQEYPGLNSYTVSSDPYYDLETRKHFTYRIPKGTPIIFASGIADKDEVIWIPSKEDLKKYKL